jgi:hypothetical protein
MRKRAGTGSRQAKSSGQMRGRNVIEQYIGRGTEAGARLSRTTSSPAGEVSSGPACRRPEKTAMLRYLGVGSENCIELSIYEPRRRRHLRCASRWRFAGCCEIIGSDRFGFARLAIGRCADRRAWVVRSAGRRQRLLIVGRNSPFSGHSSHPIAIFPPISPQKRFERPSNGLYHGTDLSLPSTFWTKDALSFHSSSSVSHSHPCVEHGCRPRLFFGCTLFSLLVHGFARVPPKLP